MSGIESSKKLFDLIARLKKLALQTTGKKQTIKQHLQIIEDYKV